MKKIFLLFLILEVFFIFACNNKNELEVITENIQKLKIEVDSVNQESEHGQSTTLNFKEKDNYVVVDSSKDISMTKLEVIKTDDKSQSEDQKSISTFSKEKDKRNNEEILKKLIIGLQKVFWKLLIGILILTAISFLIIKINNAIKDYISKQLKIEEKLIKIEININHLNNELSNLKSSPTLNQQLMDENKKRQNILEENKLTDAELNNLKGKSENKWLTIAASQIGLSHLKSNPPIPCQDNFFFKSMKYDWQLAIVCDGAGSSKYSHIGSELIAKELLPQIFDKYLQTKEWYTFQKTPSANEWRDLAIRALKECHVEFAKKIENEFENKTVREYACTVILILYNSTTALSLNVGDGRGGYLNKAGDFKPLFTPYKGEESNSTVFITSPIWDTPDIFIQTNITNEPLLSVFILSDGMEKISFNCSLMQEGKWSDPNTPFKKFFYPILTQMYNTPIGKEKDLQTMWENFLKSGHKDIENESDDKTMIVSLVK